jgi:hypothetical protein
MADRRLPPTVAAAVLASPAMVVMVPMAVPAEVVYLVTVQTAAMAAAPVAVSREMVARRLMVALVVVEFFPGETLAMPVATAVPEHRAAQAVL